MKETKQQFKREWEKTTAIIEETQKNAEQMKKEMKIHIDNNVQHHMSSQHSSVKPDSRRSNKGSLAEEQSDRTVTKSEDLAEGSQGFLEKRWKQLSSDLKVGGGAGPQPPVGPKSKKEENKSKFRRGGEEDSSSINMHPSSGRIGLPTDGDNEIRRVLQGRSIGHVDTDQLEIQPVEEEYIPDDLDGVDEDGPKND